MRLALIPFVVLLAACGDDARPLPFYPTAALTPVWGAVDAEAPRVGAFAAVDQDGRRVNEKTLDGRVTVVSFFFTHCTEICPSLRSGLARVQNSATPPDAILSFSVRPNDDTPAQLAAYGRSNGVRSERWRLLNASAGTVAALARSPFFVSLPDTSAAVHTEVVYLLDGQRRVRGVYDGTTGYDTDRLIEDVAALRAEG